MGTISVRDSPASIVSPCLPTEQVSGPSVFTATVASHAAPLSLCSASVSIARSCGARTRGRSGCTTSLRRILIEASAEPTARVSHATAIRRNSPANSGRSSGIVVSPEASRATFACQRATGLKRRAAMGLRRFSNSAAPSPPVCEAAPCRASSVIGIHWRYRS